MINQKLQEMLLFQSNITTIIIALTALILFGILMDVCLHFIIKYYNLKKSKEIEKQNEKE